MAKKQALLFELMKEETQPQAEKGFWGQLFRKKGPATSEPAPEIQKVEVSPFLESPQPQVAVEVPAERPEPEREGYEEPGEMQVYLKVNTFTKVLGITVVVVIFFCGYILGYHFGKKAGQELRSDKQLSEIASQTPNEDVLKVGPVERPAKKVTPKTESSSPAATGTPKDILKNEGKITRKVGLFYLIIHVSRDSSEIEHAMEFLATKGIETSMEKVTKARKSPLYVLVSAAGFNTSDSQGKQQSLEYQKQIKALGQQYRQVKGSKKIDFDLCYYRAWPL